MVAFDQARVTDRLPLAASCACEQGASWHGLQARCLGMRDVSAVVAAYADCVHPFDIAFVAAHDMYIQNVEKASVGHCLVPRTFVRGACRWACIM